MLKLLFIFSLFWACSIGLYEDQIGTYDWRQQYVGKVQFANFEHVGHLGKRLLIATEENLIASLSAKNGQLGWRQILERGQTGRIDAFLETKEYVVLVTGGGSFVRCFSPSLGNLVWEVAPYTESSSERGKLLLFGGDTETENVALLVRGQVSVFDIENGIKVWETQLPSRDTVRYEYLTRQPGGLAVVGVTHSSHVTVVKLLEEDGQVKSEQTVSAAWMSQQTSCGLVRGSHFVCVDSDSGTLHVVSLDKPEIFKSVLLQDFNLNVHQASVIEMKNKAQSLTIFGLKLGSKHHAIFSISDGIPRLFLDLPGVSAVDESLSGSTGVLLTVGREKEEMLFLKSYNMESGEVMSELSEDVPSPGHHGIPEKIFGLVFRKKDRSIGCRILVVSEDHSMALMYVPGGILWVREEALAGIVSVEMLDLPLSQIQAKMEEEFSTQDDLISMFYKRFSSQFAQIKAFLRQLPQKLRLARHQHSHSGGVEIVDEVEEEEDEEEYLTRDEFSLHKMIVVATRTGKIFGLDNLTGRIMWRQYLSLMSPFKKFGQENLPLFVQRTTAHFPYRPQCAILGKHKVSGSGIIFVFDPITGEPIEDEYAGGLSLGYEVLQATILAHNDEHFLRPLLVLDSNLKYHVLPEVDTKLAGDLSKSLYMFTTDVDSGLLQGYGMVKSDTGLDAVPLWTVDLHRDSQTITNVVVKRAAEHVHSQGIVLADRSVIYKYLNPNLIAVTTEGLDNQHKGVFTVYLIDAVTGNMVFHCNHKRSKGPLTMVHSENWVVYLYWNEKQRRNEMAVLELYEGKKQSNATAFSAFSPPPPPIVMNQSFIFPGQVSTMAVTITEKGITSKLILVALEMGGILGMPKMFLDPRRPLVPTAEHREEGIMPYIPELRRAPDAMVNYNQSVFNVRGIHTAPAGLESTSLVLCYGLDLFYTRVFPSKLFDVLKQDFDYAFISSVLLGMILVSVISQKLAARKALHRAWK